MKKLSILILACLPFFACNEDDFQGQFILPIRNLTFNVDPTIQPPLTYYIPIENVQTNLLNLLAANDMSLSELEVIVPRTAVLTVPFQEAKIDFIRAMSIRLCPLDDNQQNCGQEAFWQTNIPFETTGFSLGLNGSSVSDLDKVLRNEVINVQIKLEELYAQPVTSFTINVDMEFEVR